MKNPKFGEIYLIIFLTLLINPNLIGPYRRHTLRALRLPAHWNLFQIS